MKKFWKLILGAAMMVGMSVSAEAHTTSLGFVAGANPGEVTFWAGSYAHGGVPKNEGLVKLEGLFNGFSQVKAFNIAPTSIKPTGLINGTNNFFWGSAVGGKYPFPLSVDPVLFGGVVWWQGVTFTGLNPGDYVFGCGTTCGTTAQWSSLNGAGDTVKLTLSGKDIGGGGTNVPEPATMLMLGAGLIGFAASRRKAA